MKKPVQILLIHGGTTFKNYKDYINFLETRNIKLERKPLWFGDYLDKSLKNDFQIIRPRMPRQDGALYKEWAIHFSRYIPKLDNNIILIGVSLGGIFLAKYLSANKISKKIISTILVCPPYDNSNSVEELVGGFRLAKDLSLLEKNTKNLHLLFSNDDEVVPPIHAKKYAAKLKKADIVIYDDKNGHFIIDKFPEIIKMIKNDVKKY